MDETIERLAIVTDVMKKICQFDSNPITCFICGQIDMFSKRVMIIFLDGAKPRIEYPSMELVKQRYDDGPKEMFSALADEMACISQNINDIYMDSKNKLDIKDANDNRRITALEELKYESKHLSRELKSALKNLDN